MVDATGEKTVLADELSTIKSMLTVNTSAVSQAVIGGMLLASNCSLRAANRETIALYRRNLGVLLDALDREFSADFRERHGIRWTEPAGGFFVVVDTPVPATVKLLEVSAREYGVLWTPMSFFYPDGDGEHSIRLSCSVLEPAQIDEGVRRLAELISDTV